MDQSDEILLHNFIAAAQHSFAWHLETQEGVANPQQRAQSIRERLKSSAEAAHLPVVVS